MGTKTGNEVRPRGTRLKLEPSSGLKTKNTENSVAPASVIETFPSVPSSNIAPLATSLPPIAPATGCVAPAAPGDTVLPTPPSETSHKNKVSA